MDSNTATTAPGRLSHIQLKTLRLLLSIDREGGLLRAARHQHIHSSALSRRLSDLEHELGYQLFERHPCGMRPTPDGARLISHLRAILQALDDALIRPEDAQLSLFRWRLDGAISQRPDRSP